MFANVFHLALFSPLISVAECQANKQTLMREHDASTPGEPF